MIEIIIKKHSVMYGSETGVKPTNVDGDLAGSIIGLIN